MNFRDFFSRSNFFCDTPELEAFIKRWLQNEGLNLKDFANFMQSIGLETPVVFTSLNKKGKSFKCVTANNSELMISVLSSDLIDYFPRIIVESQKETKTYEIITKGSSPSIRLLNKTVREINRELACIYEKFSCFLTLKLDYDTTLELTFNFNDTRGFNGLHDTMIFRNFKAVEMYLLTLCDFSSIFEVYNTIMELLDFPENGSIDISISYLQTLNQREYVRERVVFGKGLLQEYTVLENGETFNVFRDGRWVYSCDNVNVLFSEAGVYKISVIGKESIIVTTNIQSVIEYAKEKISKLVAFFA